MTRLLHLAVDKFNLDCKMVDEDAIEHLFMRTKRIQRKNVNHGNRGK